MGQRGAVLLMCVAAGCRAGQAGPMTAGQHQGVVDSITAAMAAYAASFPGRDPEAIIRFYANHPDFRYYDDGQPTTYPQMVGMIRSVMGSLRSVEGAFDSMQVTVLSASAGIATARFRDVLTDTTGAVVRLRGTVSWTWVRTPDGWRIMHGNASHVADSVVH